MAEDKVNYIDNKRFYEEIVKYKKACCDAKLEGKVKPILNNYLGDCISKIATKTSYYKSFIAYSFREEMIGDAIETCVKYFDNYNIEDPKKNPFGYFTQVVWRSFVQRINLEEKNRYITYKNFESSMIHSGQIDLLQDEENNLIPSKIYDNISDFIGNFERKEAEKKQKRIDKKKMKDQENEEANRLASTDREFDIEVVG